MSPQKLEQLSSEEAKRNIEQLMLSQVELELQNQELQMAQEQLEASRLRYKNIYDLAPVGYVTLSEQGQILEANFYFMRRQLFERGTRQVWSYRCWGVTVRTYGLG